MLSLLRLERKQTESSNPFRIRIFLFLSYSSGIKTINKLYTNPVVPSKTTPDSRPKWAKCIRPVLRPKRRKNPTRWGGTYLNSLYKGVPPPPPPLWRQNNGKEMYKTSVLQVQSCFFANYTYCCFSLFSGVAFSG